MDSMDALGYRPDRHGAFSRELLAETDDEELQEIVNKAAADLSSPVAIVSLVLDHIQFFKAAVGLPPALAAARGMHRDASFCQFVVRDGEAFEVNDAPNDPRIPKHVVKDYGFQAYLGVPIRIGGTIVGSLCVLDIKKRKFSEEERNGLIELATLVNARLEAITSNRRQVRLDLSETALQPGLAELSALLKPMQANIKGGYAAIAAVRSFLHLTKHLFSGESPYGESFKLAFEAALKANQSTEKLLSGMEAAVADSEDCVQAMERLTLNTQALRLSEIVISAQDLARHATRSIGGFPLPDFSSDPMIRTNGTLAIAIVANCLLAIAAALSETGSPRGMSASIGEGKGLTELILTASGLGANTFEAIAAQLSQQLGHEPSVSIVANGQNIILTFKATESFSAN